MRSNPNICRLALGTMLAACLVTGAPPAAGQATFRVVSDMNGYSQPWGLTEGSPGVFYGAAKLAPSGVNAVYSVTTHGATTTLASFPADYNISPPVVSGSNNRMYSSVELSDDPAAVFSVSSEPGTVQTYPGESITPKLSQSLPSGSFLGVGASLSPWYLVVVGLSGTVSPLHEFSDNALPSNALYATDGNYYGVSSGTLTSTYVYRVTPSGSFSELYTFPSVPFPFAGMPLASLVQAGDGNLYGILPSGGANGTGAVYKLTLAGEYTLLYSFPSGRNGGPTSLIEGSDGNLYGATQGYVYGGPYGGYGLLFRVTKSGQYTLLKAMDNGAVTGSCQCTLLLGSDGMIYGTTTIGGKYGGGTIFVLDVGMPKPKPQPREFTPHSGQPGTQVTIWGQNLLSATVEFNGVPATAVSNSGSSYVLATVPTGATSGAITVTTPGGTSTTRAEFTVN